MAILLSNQLNFSNDKFNFNVELKSPIIGICGDSGSGKSLYYSLINDSYELFRPSDCKVPIKCFNDPTNSDFVVDEIKRLNNHIILIDRADSMFYGNSIGYLLRQSNNQFIIFARLNNLFGITRDSMAEFISKYNDSIKKFEFYLRYLY